MLRLLCRSELCCCGDHESRCSAVSRRLAWLSKMPLACHCWSSLGSAAPGRSSVCWHCSGSCWKRSLVTRIACGAACASACARPRTVLPVLPLLLLLLLLRSASELLGRGEEGEEGETSVPGCIWAELLCNPDAEASGRLSSLSCRRS